MGPLLFGGFGCPSQLHPTAAFDRCARIFSGLFGSMLERPSIKHFDSFLGYESSSKREKPFFSVNNLESKKMKSRGRVRYFSIRKKCF